jgi:hypothetical protein
MLKVIAFNWAMKVAVEVVLTPLTYAVVGFLKRREDVDVYDEGTHFTPFSLRDEGELHRPPRIRGTACGSPGPEGGSMSAGRPLR